MVDVIDDIRETILKLVPDEEIMDALSAADDTLEETWSLYASTKDFLTRSKELLDGLLSTLTEAVKAYGTDLVNPFNLLSHPYRDGIRSKLIPVVGAEGDLKGEEWWCFDALARLARIERPDSHCARVETPASRFSNHPGMEKV